ncbi:PREDICTED: 5-hydroxytryptamine receptor 6 [Thamnophis sirtalis]|uniref:5-hydroxytryptamine receptor 6 n=1 Tax=Thamnophis sirtalis TaxID=35019 RepID=A0A6I9XXU9_9SAUR|nr:PREDICTED: 5-hydroxytryptamine receptor 6 [Thamnophis sirtalis]
MDGQPGSLNASLIGQDAGLRGSAWTAAFLCFVILLTMVGNLALILLIFSQRFLRNTSNFFLVSLFLSDLMVGLVVMPPAMLNQLYGRWVLDGAFCSVWFSFDVMCTSASILNLCVISLDRYLLIISPLKYKLRMTSSRAFWLILATWTLAALVSFLPIKMGWHKMDFDRHPLNATLQLEEEQCRLLVSLPYALIASGLTFFLPSVAILFTYCRILLAARKQALQVASLTNNKPLGEQTQQVPRDQGQGSGVSNNRKIANKHSRRALKASLTLGILLGMFFVAWLPFFVCNMAQAVCNCISEDFFDLLTWLGYCNSTMNPIIYPLFMRDFKRAMAKYLPCCPRAWERRPSRVSLSLRNSNSGPRPGVSLRNALTLPGETDSADSIVHGNDHSSQSLSFLPATRANSVHLSDAERTEPKLNLIYLNTPSD